LPSEYPNAVTPATTATEPSATATTRKLIPLALDSAASGPQREAWEDVVPSGADADGDGEVDDRDEVPMPFTRQSSRKAPDGNSACHIACVDNCPGIGATNIEVLGEPYDDPYALDGYDNDGLPASPSEEAPSWQMRLERRATLSTWTGLFRLASSAGVR
jgi:hypothetical protein